MFENTLHALATWSSGIVTTRSFRSRDRIQQGFKLYPLTRVTRLGNFRPMSHCLLRAVFFSKEAQNVGGLFSTVRVLREFLTKNGVGLQFGLLFHKLIRDRCYDF
jgi:hypothetical protein